MKHNPLLEERDAVNNLAVVCGCLELARIAPDFCFVNRMLEGARTLLIDISKNGVALEEEAERAAEAAPIRNASAPKEATA